EKIVMKIDNKESTLFTHNTVYGLQTTRAEGKDSFAAAMQAEKHQAAKGKSSSSPGAVSEKYDFRNMKPSQLKEVVARLISSGEMDFDDSSALLCFMTPGPILQELNINPHFWADNPMNVFEKIQVAMEGALSRNEMQNAEDLKKAAN